eukprot:1995679-Pleurochrysis_carterae.AAC.1
MRKLSSCSYTTTASTTSQRNPEPSTPSRWSAARSGSSTTILPALPHNTKDSYTSSCMNVYSAGALDSRLTIWSTPTSCYSRLSSESSMKARPP